MKIKLLILTFGLLSLCSLSATANAKVQWNKKVMGDMHVNTIKGFLYDVSHSTTSHQRLVLYRPQFAKALVWLNRVHADKKFHVLEKCKEAKETNIQASIVLDAIGAISDLVMKKVPHFQTTEKINEALERWRVMGKQVVVSYSEQNEIVKGKRKTKVKWTFKLNNKKTKNLIERW
jgi:hypothetical protein